MGRPPVVAIYPSEVQRIAKEQFKREAVAVERDHLLDGTLQPQHQVAVRTDDRMGHRNNAVVDHIEGEQYALIPK
jgi:hypothetical protein